MHGLQNGLWQLFSKTSTKTLSPVSLDVHEITSRLDHVEWAYQLPQGPP